MSIRQLKDEQLVLKIHETKDKGLFDEVINRYQNDVYGRAFISCNKQEEEATKLATDIFLKIWEDIESGEYKTPINVWIHMIANRMCIPYFRKYNKSQ